MFASRRFVIPILVAALVALPLVLAEGGNQPPEPAFAVVGEAVVGRPATLSAAGTADEDAANLTYAWDLDGDDAFAPTRAGVLIEHVFATPGLVNVTLLATDAEGLNATLTQAVAVDDFVSLRFEFVNPPDPDSPAFAYVRATDWEGKGIAGADVHVVVRYQIDPRLPLMETQNFHVTTGANGEKYFPLPRDSFLGNHPGRHYADATLTVTDTVLGDAEQATARITYWIDEPAILP